MTTRVCSAAIVVLILNAGVCHAASVEQPSDVLQRHIDACMAILNDSQFADHRNQALQLNRLRQLLDQAFDFQEFSRRVLADNRQKFTAGQQREFVDTFTEFLSKYYMRELQKQYTDERVSLTGQQWVKGSRALVLVEVSWKNIGIPVEVYMSSRSGTWKVYDLSVLGIGAVLNYRAQIDGVLRKESPSQIIAALKAKVRQIDQRLEADERRASRPS